MKYIFVTGAPGSKWSSVVKNIYYSPSIDRSDSNPQRQYEKTAHEGVYWDPGMEFGKFFHRLSEHGWFECEAEFDHPFSGKVCIPFDPTQVESFDVNRVPTLNQVIKDISAGKPTATLDPSLQIFKRFLEKIRLQKPRKFTCSVILVEKKAGGLDF
jgi:hypothetical protein